MTNQNTGFKKRYYGEISSSSINDSARYIAQLPRYRREHLVRFIERIPKNGTILDIGCGKGKTIRIVQLIRPDVHIIATDLSDVKDFLPESVVFYRIGADEVGMKVDDATVDAVVSEHVIEHLLYSNTFFENIWRVMKPGAEVYIETPNWTRLFIPFSPLYFWNDYTHVHPYSRTAFRRAFIEYGFEEKYVTSVSSVDFGRRFLYTRIEDGAIKTGFKSDTEFFVPKNSVSRKIWNAFLDLTIHPFCRDILIGVAKKPMVD